MHFSENKSTSFHSYQGYSVWVKISQLFTENMQASKQVIELCVVCQLIDDSGNIYQYMCEDILMYHL